MKVCKHGLLANGNRPPEYGCWRSMRRRCYDPKVNRYDRCGGRGITVCHQWQNFATFLEDMGPRPSNRHSIGRIDNNGHYCPENCRWETASSDVDFEPPQSVDQADRLLDAAESVPLGAGPLAKLATFLGASSRFWSPARRARLRAILSGKGLVAVPAVLKATALAPREEVIDEAAEVLQAIASRDERAIGILAFYMWPSAVGSQQPREAVSEHIGNRVLIARALGGSVGYAMRQYRLAALSYALTDPAPEVRDAAVQSLSRSRDSVAKLLLRHRREQEPEPFLVDAIDDALAELAE